MSFVSKEEIERLRKEEEREQDRKRREQKMREAIRDGKQKTL